MIMSNHPHRAARHGHLPGHIRDSFAQAIDAYIDSEPGAPLPLVPYEIRYRERMISIAEACRRVWNCTDFLPGSEFHRLRDCLREPPRSQTYAAAARALLHELQDTDRIDAAADIARLRLDARDAAWRELECWTFAENGGFDLSDRGESFLMRDKRTSPLGKLSSDGENGLGGCRPPILGSCWSASPLPRTL
jgi:hypothetical protein